MSYSAVVAKIKVKPHPNADRVQLGTVLHQQVVVGLNVQDGDTGVYFPPDGQLSHEFCIANDLYPRLDANGKRIGGGFIEAKNRRVRAQGFRGEKSFGLWLPISCLSYLPETVGIETGYEFTEIAGHAICNKHIVPVKHVQTQGGKKLVTRREIEGFLMHHDTKQLYRNLDQIQDGDTLIVTEKLHGTSHRVGNVMTVNQHKGAKGWLLRLLTGNDTTYDSEIVHGSRRVILDDTGGYYGSNEFRYNVTRDVCKRLRPGEVLYIEIVGWVDIGAPIMKPARTKGIVKGYGRGMVYRYGMDSGGADFYVYRIVQNYPDGTAHELTWDEVVTRCDELNIKPVPQLGRILVQASDLDQLREWVIAEYLPPLMEGESTLDDSHIREGVALRIERDGRYVTTLKHKSHLFYQLEGIAKDNAPDMEDAA